MSDSSCVVFYISGHGFGHASRSVEVINALAARRPELLHVGQPDEDRVDRHRAVIAPAVQGWCLCAGALDEHARAFIAGDYVARIANIGTDRVGKCGLVNPDPVTLVGDCHT